MTITNVGYANEQITIYPAPCPFKCKYCWSQAPLWIYRTRNPSPLKQAYELINPFQKPKTIVISFTTDPYQPRELNEHLTIETLKILAVSHHKIMILTKSSLIERDFPQFVEWHQNFKMNLWIGMTLTSVMAIQDEPLASPNPLRIKTLQNAHNIGLNTWVSIEPWIPHVTYPRQIIEATHEFVDWYVIGSLNRARQYGYPKIPKHYYSTELLQVKNLLSDYGFSPTHTPTEKGFHIKKELEQNA